MVLVQRQALPVDPAKAQRAVQHLRIAHALDTRALLSDLDPHSVCRGMVVLELALPVGGGGEEHPPRTVILTHLSRLAFSRATRSRPAREHSAGSGSIRRARGHPAARD